MVGRITITLDFEMIEGTPPRTPIRVTICGAAIIRMEIRQTRLKIISFQKQNLLLRMN